MLRDVRYALRTLRNAPQFATVAILTLALGIGLATAVFTVADALLLRQLPVRDQDRLVVLWGQLPDQEFAYSLGLDDAREFARRTRSLERVGYFASFGALPLPIRERDQISRLRRALVSGDFFDVLGARPLLGRALHAADAASGAAPVVVLSYGAWQQRFGGDTHVLGRQVVMYDDGVPYTIVGVMPQGLDYPRGTDFWAPVKNGWSFLSLDVIGRLAPGATTADARAELTAFFGRAEASPWQRDLRGVVHTLPRLVLGDVRPALFAFAAAAALLLLITCINVANLLLVRSVGRAREIAVRTALGAGRGQVVVQLVIENGLLAVAGGALGVALAAAAVRAFVAFAPAGLPRLDEIHLNATALAGAIVITGVAVLLFGLGPAVLGSSVEPQQALRSDARQSGSRRSRLATEGLVMGQVALALVVLSAAGLVARTLIELERAELSLEASHLLIGELAIRSDQYDDVAKQRALLERMLPQLRAIPGVRGVSPVVAVPFAGAAAWDGRPAAEGQSSEEAAANPMLNMDVVTPDYFKTLGIPVLRGRGFTDADRAGERGPVRDVSRGAAGPATTQRAAAGGVRGCRSGAGSGRFVRRHGDHGAPTHARARRADGTWRHSRRPAGDGHETRSHDRSSGIGAGSVRRAARESTPSDAPIRCDAHGSGDAYGGHRAPGRCRRARQPGPGPVERAGRSDGGAAVRLGVGCRVPGAGCQVSGVSSPGAVSARV